jgi:hypothetical protein
VKFLKLDGDKFVFQIGRREKSLLRDLLQLYPVVPLTHHQIGRSTPSPSMEPNQKLLEEALREHREENKKALEAMLKEPERFEEVPGGFHCVLSQFQLEWLLQVLNDIRVGSWLNLGSPDERHGKPLELNLQNARYLWAMELSGHFQMVLLSAKQSDV